MLDCIEETEVGIVAHQLSEAGVQLHASLCHGKAGLRLNAVRVFENAKSVRKCVWFGLALSLIHI